MSCDDFPKKLSAISTNKTLYSPKITFSCPYFLFSTILDNIVEERSNKAEKVMATFTIIMVWYTHVIHYSQPHVLSLFDITVCSENQYGNGIQPAYLMYCTRLTDVVDRKSLHVSV